MNVKIENSKLKGSITVPASKSVAHRVLIASLLCEKNTIIRGKLVGKDIFATIGCLENLGLAVDDTSENELIVKPAKCIKSSSITLNCKESGSTLRFLLPLAAALGCKATFVGEGRLNERPINELLEVLKYHGISVSNNALPLTISGKLSAGEYLIDGGISSQYITGLLFALPLLNGDSTIEVSGNVVSASYIDVTLSVLKRFGISIVRARNIFVIKGNQKYISPGEYNVEGDWSSAGFFAVGGALCGDVELLGLDVNSLQGDKYVLELLKRMGAEIIETEQGIEIKKSKLTAINFSAENCPDIVPIMCIALANAEGVSKISNVERLKLKESDRLYGAIEMLSNLGIRAEYCDGELCVYGGVLKGNTLNAHNDHRIAMSGTIAGTAAEGKTVIVGAECVKKSYPTFFYDHKKLGGKNNASEF